MRAVPPPPPGHPVDQAHGLRQMFQSRPLRFIPVVSNPDVIYGGLVLERLCTALAGLGLRTLVVDAGERAREPGELAAFDLSDAIERLSEHVSYLPARGLLRRHVDAEGHSDALLDVIRQAAPRCDVVLLHAPAADLVRLLARRAQGHAMRPLVFMDDNAESLTHAYGAVKVMAQRAGWMSFDLMLCTAPDAPRARLMADRMARCADRFLGATQRDWVVLNPLEPAQQDPGPRFVDMTSDLLRCALAHASVAMTTAAPHPGAALPSRLTPVFN